MWPRASATRLSSSWREEEDDWQEPVGWAELGQARRQVSPLTLSLSLFLFAFIYFLICVLKYNKYYLISKNSGNIQRHIWEYSQLPKNASKII